MEEFRGLTPKSISLKLGVSVLIWLFFKVTTAPDFQEMVTIDNMSFVYFLQTVFLTFVAWSINEFVYFRITRRYGNEFLNPKPILQFFGVSVAAVLPLFVVALWFMTVYVEEWLNCPRTADVYVSIFSDVLKSLMFNFLIVGAFVVNHFWKNKRQNELIHEKIMKENLEYKYETLKSHINPHFLFNSFSVLTALVHQNSDLASDFISKLSKIYRYVLENKDKEMVSLEEELSFLESYMFLLKIRHDKGIEVSYDVKIRKNEYSIPALALQMLAENAAKHNSFSQDMPLKLNVFTEDGEYLVIRNNLNIRQVSDSSGTGLNNIRERYNLLSENQMIVEKDEGFFTVKLPLIKTAS
jgi:hypothetical protein